MYRTKKDIEKLMKKKYGENMNPNLEVKKESKKAEPKEVEFEGAKKALMETDRNNVKKIAKHLEIKVGKKHTETIVDEILEEVGEEKALQYLSKAESK